MSLTACIRKAAKAISPEDGQYLSQVRAEFMEQGLDAKEADRRAVQSLLDLNETEMRGLSAQIEEKGGKPLFDPPPTPPIAEQPIQFQRVDESVTPRGATRRPNLNVPLADEEFDTVLNGILGSDNDSSEFLNVISTFEELPDAIRNTAREQGSDGSDVFAVYHKGQVYVVKDKIRSKTQLEEALFHEFTHGGTRQMFNDEGVATALNGLWDAMGRQTGFEKLVKELGIEKQISVYEKAGDRYDEATRNAILVDEMIALVGEKGSKGLKLKVQELIGAIRQWLRDNGFMRLARMRASDIAAMAKRGREMFMRGQETEDGPIAFSMERRRNQDPLDFSRPYTGNPFRESEYTVGLYSNAEKVVIEQGDKIFKPSNKNPEGKATAQQVMQFLSTRGLKQDELFVTRLEGWLRGKGSVTKEDLIRELRASAAIEIEQETSDVNRDDDGDYELAWEMELIDDPAEWEYITENVLYEKDTDGDFGLAVDAVRKENLSIDLINDALDSPIRYESEEEMQEAVGDERFYEAVYKAYESEVDEKISDFAREQYMDNPYYNYTLTIERTDTEVKFGGNDDTGYYGTVSTKALNPETGEFEYRVVGKIEEVYDLDEAKVQAVTALYEHGLVPESEAEQGDTRFFNYLELDDERPLINSYREVVVRIDTPHFEKPYTGGHFGGENMLAAMLVTERRGTDMGSVFFIEEMQSDWHSDIRRMQGTQLAELAEEVWERELLEVAAKHPIRTASILTNHSEEEIRNTVAKYRAIAKQKGIVFKGYRDDEEIAEAKQEREDVWEKRQKINDEQIAEIIEVTGVIAEKIKAGSFEEFEALAPPRRMGRSDAQQLESDAEYFQNKAMNVFALDEMLTDEGKDYVKKFGASMPPELDDVSAPIGRLYEKWITRFMKEKYHANGDRFTTLVKHADLYQKYGWWFEEKFGEVKPQLQEIWQRKLAMEDMYDAEAAAERKVANRLGAPPNSPFRDDRYITFMLKNALVKAVDEGFTSIGFSNGQRVTDRWSDNNDYRPIYDQKMLKAARKLFGTEEVITDLGSARDPDKYVFPISESLRKEVIEEGLPMFQRRSEFFQSPEEGFADRFLRTFQDKFIGVKRLQEKIAEHRGVELRPEDNPYIMEQFMSGKVEEDYKKIDREYVKPLVQLMSQKDIDIDMLDVYLIARHAPERNAYIASINDQLPDGGSGMTNQQAQTWMQEFRAQGKLPALAEASKIIDSMIADTRTLMRTAGLIDEPTERMLEEKFKHYVPLKGIAEDEEGAMRPRTGSGFEIRGGEFKRAMGRTTMPESPTAHALQGLFEKVIRSRKNEVGQTFLELVEQNPNPAYWEVFTQENPDTTRQMTTKNGEEKVNNEAKLNYHSPFEYFTVKRDGVEHYIKLKDPVMFETMKNLGSEPLSKFMTGIAIGTRIQAMLNTSLNPNFVLVNPVRDVQTAIFNMLGEQSKAGGKIEGLEIIYDTVVKDLKNAVPAIYKYERNMDANPNYKVPNNLQKDYQEFLDMGAKTGFFDSPDIATIQRQLHTAFNLAGKDATMSSARAFRELLRWIETANIAMENGVRLAAYKNARDQKYKQLLEQGESPEQAMETAKVVAADLAKNLTVNFNRKGEQGAFLNAFYMFFNASVQGTKQLADSLGGYGLTEDGKKKMTDAQKLVAALMFAGFANALFNRMTMGEDEDEVDKWDKVPSYVRERNFVINLDWMGYEDRQVTIPLPYGYNVFYNIGDAMEALVNSDSSVRQASAFTDLARSTVNSFSPVGYHGGDSLDSAVMLTVMPTLATPLAEIGYNTNYFGGPIHPEQRGYGPQMNQANTHFRTTKEPYKAMAKFLSERTGGGVYIQGGVDVYPDTLEHIVEAYGGGLYRAVTQAGEVVSATAEQRSLAPNNIPFARSFFREQTYYEDVSLFYDRAEYLAELNKEHKEAEDAEKFRLKQKYGDLIGKPLLNAAERTRKMLAELRDKRDKIQADETLSERERDLQLEEIEDRVKDKVDSFNLRYNKAEG